MFKAMAIVETSPATYRQVNYWVNQGLLHPMDRRRGVGRGYEFYFLGAEYMRAREMAQLVHLGVTPKLAEKLADGTGRGSNTVWIPGGGSLTWRPPLTG